MEEQEENQRIKLVPETFKFPELYKLSGKEAEERLKEYSKKIKHYDKRARGILDIFSLRNNELCGSNPFANVLLASEDIALPSELEQAVRINPDYFSNTYEDIALILRTAGDSYQDNDYVAKHLAEQLKKRKVKLPARISLRGLSLKKDNNSAYGLVFKLEENTEILHVPDFTHRNNGKRFFKTDERGIPIFEKEGDRYFHTRKDGLSRLYLGGGLYLGSYGESLADSSVGGRVVIVSGEAADFDFAQKLKEEQKANVEALKLRAKEEYNIKAQRILALAKELKLE